MSSTISHHTALIYTMVIVSAADSVMTDQELFTIGEVVRSLPVFRDFNPDWLTRTAEDCAQLLNQDDGLEAVFGLIKEALPANLRETAYAVACDVAAADLHADQEELRMLELLRHKLGIDRLHAAAIERGARARFSVILES